MAFRNVIQEAKCASFTIRIECTIMIKVNEKQPKIRSKTSEESEIVEKKILKLLFQHINLINPCSHMIYVCY